MNDVESQVRPIQERKPAWMEYLPIISVIIGLCAFSFQVLVLYPWHEELSREFKSLAKEVRSAL